MRIKRIKNILLRLPALYLYQSRSKSKRRLRDLKDVHYGRTIFVAGAGPSLNDVDMFDFSRQVVVSCHHAYKKFISDRPQAHYWVVGAESRMKELSEVDRGYFNESIYQFGDLGKHSYQLTEVLSDDVVIRPVFRFNPSPSTRRAFLDYKSGTLRADILPPNEGGGVSFFKESKLHSGLGQEKLS